MRLTEKLFNLHHPSQKLPYPARTILCDCAHSTLPEAFLVGPREKRYFYNNRKAVKSMRIQAGRERQAAAPRSTGLKSLQDEDPSGLAIKIEELGEGELVGLG
jgi:hypothetical protein